jgi:hypothetical protein
VYFAGVLRCNLQLRNPYIFCIFYPTPPSYFTKRSCKQRAKKTLAKGHRR